MIKARQVVNNGWDVSKDVTEKQAREYFPLYKSATINEEKFNWVWYYAMQDVGDQSAHKTLEEYFTSLEESYKKTADLSLFVPSVYLQMIFNRFSGTDQQNHINYYKEVLLAKDRMREKFLPRVIAGEKLTKEQLIELPKLLKVETYIPSQSLEGMRFWIFNLIGGFFFFLGISRLFRFNNKGMS